MAIVTTDNQHYTDIAAAIRSKNGTETQYKPSEMAAAIQAISGGGEPEPPDDGKTRLYITIPANAMPDRPPPRNQVPLYIQQTVANGVTIDWGDGTAPETLPGIGAVNTTHTYEQAGDYVISLEPVEGCELKLGGNSSGYCVMGHIDNFGKVYRNMLQKVYIGKNIKNIGFYSFYDCSFLELVVLSNHVETITDSCFSNCYSLKSVINTNKIIRIGVNAFYNCGSLASIVISEQITNINSVVFKNCYGMKEYHFLSDIPPTLSNMNAFEGIPSDCIIYVPKGSVEDYKTETNWPVVADHIQEEPA